MSRKSFASLEIDQLVTLSLSETFVFFLSIPCQSTYCHNFTSETFLQNYSCQEYTIDSAHIRTRIPGSGKGSFAQIIFRSTYCFTGQERELMSSRTWYLQRSRTEVTLPMWSESLKISEDDLEKL